jgi:pyruvate/2-oxoglutarate/acetoin dehydrogenase E1 component
MRPIAEIMYVDFLTIAMDQLAHVGAYNRYMFGGKAKVPMVLRTEGGVGRCIAAQHPRASRLVMHTPVLYVVMPSTPYSAKGLLKAASRSENPVSSSSTSHLRADRPDPDGNTSFRWAGRHQAPGNDATIVSYIAWRAGPGGAKVLADKHGIDVEVIDLRTLKPLDIKTVAESVRKTGRLITLSEGFGWCGTGREITGQYMEYDFGDGTRGFDYLGARPINLAARDVPPPMSEPLEEASIPGIQQIVEAVKQSVGQ